MEMTDMQKLGMKQTNIIQMINMKHFHTDSIKLHSVIQSAKTREQMKAAFKYYKLWCKKYRKIPSYYNLAFWSAESWARGYMTGWTNKLNQDEKV